MDYHLSIAGQNSGPHSQFYVIEKIRDGSLQGDEPVWRIGLPGWLSLRELDEFTSYWPPGEVELAVADATRVIARKELDRPQPWLRFWARIVDYTWFIFFVSTMMRALLPVSAAEWVQATPWVQVLMQFFTFLLYALVEAWFLSQRGTTPGKALLRIQVLSKDGQLPTYRQALLRSLQVWIKGMGCTIVPLISLATMYWWRYKLLKNRTTGWDETSGTRVEHGEPETWRYVVLAGLISMIAVLFVAGMVILSKELQGMMHNLPK